MYIFYMYVYMNFIYTLFVKLKLLLTTNVCYLHLQVGSAERVMCGRMRVCVRLH